MNIPELKSVHWISPPNLGGENVSSILRRYVERLGWNTQSDNPAIIYCGSESQIERAAEAKEKYKIPVIMNFWGWMPERFRIREWRIHYANKIDLIDRIADAIIVPARLTFEQLAFFGINKPSYISPPGIDLELAHSIISSTEYKFILSIGRLVEHKRFYVAIDALSKLSLGLPYFIIGDGPLAKELQSRAKDKNVELYISSEFNDEDKFRTLKNALCLIAPSSYEGFGMSIVEAATLGIPVLASDLPIYRELFEDYLIYFRSTEELTSLIAQIYESATFRKKASRNISCLGLKYSGFHAASDHSRILSEQIASYLKNKLWDEYKLKLITTEELYNIEAKLDKELFSYRLRPDIGDYVQRLEFLMDNATGKKVLDAACSNGIFALHLAANNYDVTAVDISEEYLLNAKRLVEKYELTKQVEFIKTDLETLEIADNSFDCVWAGEIIEHFENPSKLLFQLIRVLRPNGRLIFSVPYSNACDDPMHQQIFNNEDDIRNIFSEFKNFKLEVIQKKLGNNKNWVGYGTKI